MKMEILCEMASNTVIDALDVQGNKFSGKTWLFRLSRAIGLVLEAFDFVHVHGQFHTLPLNSTVEGNFI